MRIREKGHCKKCGGDAGEENLSNRKLCYGCARGAMLKFFDNLWVANHPGIRSNT